MLQSQGDVGAPICRSLHCHRLLDDHHVLNERLCRTSIKAGKPEGLQKEVTRKDIIASPV
ncbi:hypothetical protein CY34DRAFT_500288 [Suillus luteus UH-Slu-Lm8-n1]|uniref:Uncharacterized protein n=1 Tax=Suillus luteus UH-Slu-Lm8-n1 TaxID=930992 RepID=A0A0D0BRH9_9AGAM|nr:hypothetical protein CY34DRAFT_500288 [Suillus luteus UH-Slu-Lm8-n1]